MLLEERLKKNEDGLPETDFGLRVSSFAMAGLRRRNNSQIASFARIVYMAKTDSHRVELTSSDAF
jgi:hypothetical protein